MLRGLFFLAASLALLSFAPAQAAGDGAAGRKLAERHCARCHVVGEATRYAGINSTPSFQLLAKRDDYLERFRSFYDRRPHPVFVRVPGVPAWTDLPSPVASFEITLEQIDDLVAYVETLRPQ